MLFKTRKKKPEEILAAAVPIPTTAVDKRYSALSSFEQQPGHADTALMQLALDCVHAAFDTDLSEFSARLQPGQTDYFSIFPGEHYRLLAGIMKKLQPKSVVELGTFLGYSALCMKKYMPADGVLHTFDVIKWSDFEQTILREEDFDGRLVQHTADLTDKTATEQYRTLLENADIIFLDALKDGIQEYKFLENFSTLQFKKSCLFLFDDIRLWNMLDIWYRIDRPKIDLTSFGHWSGTGMVAWQR